MEAVLAFAAGVLALRLAGRLATRWRVARSAALAAWSASLISYAVACAALAWGAAAGWSEAAFRVYYLFGGLLTAPLLGLGSLLLVGGRAAIPVALLYAGAAVGVVLAEPFAEPVGGSAIPEAGEHLDFFPARLLAVIGNTVGTLAVVAVAVASLRRRPLGNALIVLGVAAAAVGTSPIDIGGVARAGLLVGGALLLYAGVVAPARRL